MWDNAKAIPHLGLFSFAHYSLVKTLKHSKKGCKCSSFMSGTGIRQVTPQRREVHYPAVLLSAIQEAEDLQVTWEAPPFPFRLVMTAGISMSSFSLNSFYSS